MEEAKFLYLRFWSYVTLALTLASGAAHLYTQNTAFLILAVILGAMLIATLSRLHKEYKEIS